MSRGKDIELSESMEEWRDEKEMISYFNGELLVSPKRETQFKSVDNIFSYEGLHKCRYVNVKHYESADPIYDPTGEEYKNHSNCDRHQNIIRFYDILEQDRSVYLIVERSISHLTFLIQMDLSKGFVKWKNLNSDKLTVISFWRKNEKAKSSPLNGKHSSEKDGYPSSFLLTLMREIVAALKFLHEDMKTIHGNLTPDNVMMVLEANILCVKVSDFSKSQRLNEIELLERKEAMEEEDVHHLLGVLFFCLTRGRHQFTIDYDPKKIDNIPEAADLFEKLTSLNKEKRPTLTEALKHPLFWNSDTRLKFLCAVSDLLVDGFKESDPNKRKSLVNALGKKNKPIFGGKPWNQGMDPTLTEFIDKNGDTYTYTTFDKVVDLLRVIRNKFNHHRQLSSDLQKDLYLPEGYDDYFRYRTPTLLIEVYNTLIECKECQEECKKILADIENSPGEVSERKQEHSLEISEINLEE